MKIFIALSLMGSLCFGQGTPIRLSEKVLDHKNRIEAHNLPNHVDWVQGNLNEYEIIKDKNLGGHKEKLEKMFSLSSKYIDDAFVMENEMDTVKFIDDLTNHKYRKFSIVSILPKFKSDSKKMLEFMGNDIQFENHEARYLDGVLYRLNIRYRRIFEGAVVRNNVSYVEIMFDMSGNVERVEMKWPSFKKIVSKNDALNSEEIFSEYMKEASLQSEVHNESGDTLTVDSISTVGSSFAWRQLDNRIVPAMSFLQVVHFEKEKIHTFVDVPYFKKYLRND